MLMKMTDIRHLIFIGSGFNTTLQQLSMRLFTALKHHILGSIKITTVNLTFFHYNSNLPVYILILVMKNCPSKSTLHQGLSLRVDRKH